MPSCAHSDRVGMGCSGQKLGASVRNGMKSTLEVTASPEPGPTPEGPLAAPHQLVWALTVGEPPLKTRRRSGRYSQRSSCY